MSTRRKSRRGDTEEEPVKAETPHKGNVSPATALDNQRGTDNEDDAVDDGMLDSEDGSLVIADMQEGKDTDDTENNSEHSEEEEPSQLIFNGTMTRRQSKQFQDAGGNFAVYSVRSGGKSKNRTCEYCGVVKATPAALVRHIRKHTGERPFVCQVCGKAYKAKRSLHLHQNSQHKEMGKMLPPNPSSLPTQVPIQSPVVSQMSPTQAISEVTKSLLRETLEISRKAKDGSTGSQTPEAQASSGSSPRSSERLSTPNLVNLLTSDISRKAIQGEETISVLKLKSPTDGGTHLIMSPTAVKKEEEDVKDEKKKEVEEVEEQAQDLSMATMQKPKVGRPPASEKRMKCEFCNKSFKHDISLTNHVRTVHGIIINVNTSGNYYQPAAAQGENFTRLESKMASSISSVAQHKSEPANQKQETPTDLSISSLLARSIRESPSSFSSQEALKSEVASLAGANSDGLVIDESNTLPYHVTSRMVQDFNVEELSIKDTEKSVIAEDGGNRRLRMTVCRETVLATRLDGINNITGRQATVFKCHLCLRVFSSIVRYSHHLPSHYDTEIQTYDCRYCEASFRSHNQIVKHLQCHKEKFTGLNQSGTALNSSALLLEDFQRRQKGEQVGDHSLNSSSASAFSPVFHSDDSHSNTPQLEPGERVNGGYSCVKCRKSFSREYLLQRHMRIHQNQTTVYCPDCDSGFTGEQDLLEHRRLHHGVKAPDQLQYSTLLKSLNTSLYDPKSGQGVRQTSTTADSNNNNSISNTTSLVYPMKAFDLKRGEAVEIPMSSEVSDLEARRAALEEYQYKTLMLMNAAAARGNDKMWQSINTAAAEELKRRMKVKEAELKKKREEEEARLKVENEKRRKLEQEKLKRKLAQEGMGDVTVVLPDAPPADDTTDVTRDADRPTDLSVTVDPPSGVGFMARKSGATTAATSAASRIDHVLQTEYGASSNTQEPVSDTIAEKSAVKRPAPPSSSEPAPGPPSKSRRKAHKPQRINHFQEEGSSGEKEKGDDNNNSKTSTAATATSSSLAQQSVGVEDKNQNMKLFGLDPAVLNAQVLSQLSQFNQMAGLPGAGAFLTPEMARKHIAALTASSLMSSQLNAKYGEGVVAGLDATGNTVFFNAGAASAAATNSNSDDANNNGGAIDLSTDSKDRQTKSSAALTTYQAYMTKMAAASSSSSSQSSSPPPLDGTTKQGSKKRKSNLPSFTRRVSLDPATLESDNSLSQELTSAADLSKTSVLTLQIPPSLGALSASQNPFATVPPTSSPSDLEGLVGCPRVLWKMGQGSSSEVPDNFLGVIRGGQFNGKGNKSSGSAANRSRTSTPSPAPSPTNSDASSSAEGRKVTTTSLSRTHSRLSVVNEPLDRNSLCKPKTLDDGRSVYSCAICHKQFLSLSDINRHMDFHEDIRPYKCKYCDYYARTNSQLKVHKLRHEGVREFCCRVCNYKGVTQSDLNRHMKSQVHLLRSNHVCNQCGEGFVTPKTLRDHAPCCTGNVDKSFDMVSSEIDNENDDEVNDEEYEEEELLNMEEASQGSQVTVA